MDTDTGTSPVELIPQTAPTHLRRTRLQKRDAHRSVVDEARGAWRRQCVRLDREGVGPEVRYVEAIRHWRGLFGEGDWALWRRACRHAGHPFEGALVGLRARRGVNVHSSAL